MGRPEESRRIPADYQGLEGGRKLYQSRPEPVPEIPLSEVSPVQQFVSFCLFRKNISALTKKAASKGEKNAKGAHWIVGKTVSE